MNDSTMAHVAVVGGGFTGLSAAYELTRLGLRVSVFERDPVVGGLAGSFDVDGEPLEKFYHHWFTNDRHVMQLVDDLGTRDRIVLRPTSTGMYFAQNIYRLSSPADVMRFDALPLLDRVRLGLGVLRACIIIYWRPL